MGISFFLFLSTSHIVENKRRNLLPCLLSLLLCLLSVFLCLISLLLLFKEDQLCRQCQGRKQAECYLFFLKSLLALRALNNDCITKQNDIHKGGVPLFHPRGLGEYHVLSNMAVGGIPISPGGYPVLSNGVVARYSRLLPSMCQQLRIQRQRTVKAPLRSRRPFTERQDQWHCRNNSVLGNPVL